MTSLTQAQIDGYNRFAFVRQVLDYVEPKTEVEAGKTIVHVGREAKFVAHRTKHKLISIKRKGTTVEWEISIGKKNMYSYRLSDVVEMLEKLYDSGASVISLDGEIQIAIERQVANDDAVEEIDNKYF